MKILVLSDSHGRDGRMELAIEQESPLDMLIHLGDLEGSEDILQAMAPCPVKMVRGNNDYFSPCPRDLVLTLCGKRIFLCHGHTYRADKDRLMLALAARERECGIALYGHTHRPALETLEGVILANPGSISYPRQADGRPSYMVMTLAQGKEPEFAFYYMHAGTGGR